MKAYQFTEAEQATFWQLHSEHYKADLIADLLVGWGRAYVGKKVLDVGAGSGALLRELRKQFPALEQLVGLDIAPKSDELIKGSCTQIPFGNSSFDTVFMTDVIEHLSDEDLIRALSEMARVVDRGGHLLITTIDNEDLAKSAVPCPSCAKVFHRWGHCQVFSIERFRDLARAYGLELLSAHTTNLGRLKTYGLVAKLVYWLGIDKIFRPASWHEDLLIVLRKK